MSEVLRDKLIKWINMNDSRIFKGLLTIDEAADEILSLIEAERCVWTKDEDGDWDTECGCCYDGDNWYEPFNAYCPCCGKRIEVKDEYG